MMNQKLIFRIMTLVALSGLFFACKNKSNMDKTAAQPPVAVCPEPSAIQINMEYGPMDVVYYIFKESSARMVVPEAWMDDCTFTPASIDDCDGCVKEYEAYYMGADNVNGDFLGAISIFTTAQWNAIPQDNKGIYVKVGEVDGYIYGYRSAESNPYDPKTKEGKGFESHLIYMNKTDKTIIIEKWFPYTVKLDESVWNVSTTEEGGIEAQKDGMSMSLGTSTGSGRGLKNLDDVKNNIIKSDKTVKTLSEPVKIDGFDAVCYESNSMSNMKYACVAYIQTGKEDFKMLVVGGKKNQANEIKNAFKEFCTSFQKKFSGI